MNMLSRNLRCFDIFYSTDYFLFCAGTQEAWMNSSNPSSMDTNQLCNAVGLYMMKLVVVYKKKQ